MRAALATTGNRLSTLYTSLFYYLDERAASEAALQIMKLMMSKFRRYNCFNNIVYRTLLPSRSWRMSEIL